jgi:probable H4MPT-linked C1 transfer pathway protein
MTWLGLDIGGANLKAADDRGWTRSVPFPLWREPDLLAQALGRLIADAPDIDRLAVTMTGELCDCYRTKAEGVSHILTAVEEAAAGRQVTVYLVDGRLVPPDEARREPHLAAASNWHVLARFACQFVESQAALLIDVGSTTTDIIPLVDRKAQARGLNDTERLAAGELAYSGIGRTPVCAVVEWLPWRGKQCPVAAELFATTGDAYVLLGDVVEQADNTSTADGRPRTREFALERLARMICADSSTFTAADGRLAAEHVRRTQITQITNAVQRVATNMTAGPGEIVLSGAGEFLATAICQEVFPQAHRLSLAERIGRDASLCAPAYALARVAAEGG